MGKQTKAGQERIDKHENILRRYEHIEGNGGSKKRNKRSSKIRPKRINGAWGLEYSTKF